MIKSMVKVYESYQKGNNTNYKPSNDQIMDRILTHLETGGMLPPTVKQKIHYSNSFEEFLDKWGIKKVDLEKISNEWEIE